MVTPGRLLILNGASSSGKTSLATGFQSQRAEAGEQWMLIGIDEYLAKLPIELLDLGLPGGPGPFADHGLTLRDGVLRMGPVCRELLRSYRADVAAAVRDGKHVIVDDVVIDDTCWTDWLEALGDLQPVWVAVQCSEAVRVERERARADRAIGMTAAQTGTVHRHPTYAFEIDTTTSTPDEALGELRRLLR